MVKICSVSNYPLDNENKYCSYFEKFSHPLHIFQKWAVEGIVEGNNVLITAPTGSGKSLPAEFAIDFFHSCGKKSIYCSPIKSLSNQKYYDFSQKYPHIKIGLITGDIRCNPDADVIVMTTEILLNKLYHSSQKTSFSTTSFEMDIETELGCVIFDEIHMISNESRGYVWENSIMLLPRHIQLIGLSATLDNPEKFALWIENREKNEKQVYLTCKKERTVPLIHYTFITVTQGIFKAIKDKQIHEEINKMINKPLVIQNAKNEFNEIHCHKMHKTLKLFVNNKIWVKRAHALNQVTKYLTTEQMTPAICYVFSIKNLEVCATEISTDLLEFDSKIPYIVANECEQILRSKLPNFEEYLHLPEYLHLISLLQKGIATHHSKMLPILREIVELLFAKGYIKLLFATETVAIGLNLPVKTCIFTDIYKHDGQSLRILQPHEYTQAAGRAGRLGIDTVGHVVHLNNLFRETSFLSYKQMMNGTPQGLTSKFALSYNLVLNMIEFKNEDICSFVKQSMGTQSINKQIVQLENDILIKKKELDTIQKCITCLKTPVETIESYISLQKEKLISVNKKRKEIEKKIGNIIDNYHFIENDKNSYEKYKLKYTELNQLENELIKLTSYIQINIANVMTYLTETQLIENRSLTMKGKIASQLREVHCILFAELITNKETICALSTVQLIALFSCFTNINIQKELKDGRPSLQPLDEKLQQLLENVSQMLEDYTTNETLLNIHNGTENIMHFDLLHYINDWCLAENIDDCKRVLQKLNDEKEMHTGDFIKALLKIQNISVEMEKIAELIENIDFLHKMREIPSLILKYVATTQSLYV